MSISHGFWSQEQTQVVGPIRKAFEDFPEAWRPMIDNERGRMVINQICNLLDQPKHLGTYNPPPSELFMALAYVPPQSVRAVVVGQDPYPGKNYAHGVAFSCRPGTGIADSLRRVINGLKKIAPDYPEPSHGYLGFWMSQGVLLLNSSFTVRKSDTNLPQDKQAEEVHRYCWRQFIKLITDYLQHLENERLEWARSQGVIAPRIVYAGVGKMAEEIISPLPALFKLFTGHPSSRNVRATFDAKIFVEITEALMKQGQSGVDWRIPDMN